MATLEIEITVVGYTTAIIDFFEHSEVNAGNVRFAITWSLATLHGSI